MNIPVNILKRIQKFNRIKPELQNVFVQDGHEHITNTFFMVRMLAQGAKDTTGEFPVMKVAEKMNMPKDDSQVLRIDVDYLIDVLEILKKNKASHVDIKFSERAMHLKGLSSPVNKNTIDISALIMGCMK